MREILERIAIKGTENRRNAIIEILEENNIPYELQEIEHKRRNFFSNYYGRSRFSDYSYKKPQKEKISYPDLGDEELNNFVAEDISSLEEEYDINSEEYDLAILYSMYGMLMDKPVDEESEEDTLYDEYSYKKNTDYEYSTDYLYNIIITPSKEFYESDNKILFSAHYDVVSGSTGANDNGSSIAILLKLIINLYKSNKTNLPISFVFFDGEETGGIGSNAYIEKYLDTEEKRNELTLINLDVCGCGDFIVIVDNILNYENNSNLLLTEKNREKYQIVEASRFPFSDASIFKEHGIGALSISVFPYEDVELLYKKEEPKIEVIDASTDNVLTKYKKHFGSYIWQYMHNGKYDDISYINYDIMQLTYEYILNCLEIN